ncbi:MAG: SDR family NAD(P)-dependent oxidoreductase [Limosilactobacillus mucosae]
MYSDLQGKVAVVTGGNSGIGRGIAERFAEEGAHVVITGRNEKTLKEVASENDLIDYVVADLTEEGASAKLVNFVKNKFDALDILVNNAGWCPVQNIKQMTIADYNKAFDLDVKAVVDLTITALPLLLKSKGTIINLSSVGATHPGINLSMYCGAKAAIENFTKVWALELAEDGVRVNAIAPGAIETNIWNVPGLTEEQSAAHRHSIEEGIPMKKMGEPTDIGNIAAYLASSQAKYVTGSVFKVDGGLAV